MNRIVVGIFSCVAMVGTLVLGGCAKNISPSTYTGREVGAVAKVKRGVIIAQRAIKIDNNRGMGGLAGVAGGAAAGSSLGGGSAAHVVGAIGGAVVGGIIGNQVDKVVNTHTGYEYIIELSDKSTIAVTQEKNLQLAVGQRVMIIYGEELTRVIPDSSATP